MAAERRAIAKRVAGTMAHATGTPLNVIIGRATMLAEDSNRPGASQAQRIAEQGNQLAATVREVLAFLRTDAPEREQRDTCQLLRFVVDRVGGHDDRMRVQVMDGNGVVASVDGGAVMASTAALLRMLGRRAASREVMLSARASDGTLVVACSGAGIGELGEPLVPSGSDGWWRDADDRDDALDRALLYELCRQHEAALERVDADTIELRWPVG